jgi:hypothetical protein
MDAAKPDCPPCVFPAYVQLRHRAHPVGFLASLDDFDYRRRLRALAKTTHFCQLGLLCTESIHDPAHLFRPGIMSDDHRVQTLLLDRLCCASFMRLSSRNASLMLSSIMSASSAAFLSLDLGPKEVGRCSHI